MSSKRSAEAEVIRVLRAIRSLPADDRERRTTLLRDLGEATVSLREHFLTVDGSPDWGGRTGAYRAAIAELYSDAGYSADEARATQKLARYHIANTLRDQLSPEDIEAMGQRAETPRERQAEIRERQAAIVAAASAHIGVPETAEERVAYLRGVLGTLDALRPLTPEQRAQPDYAAHYQAAKRLLEQVATRAHEIIRTWPEPSAEPAAIE
jgi:hypothetical protein